jgi:hypothetical protein
MPIALAAFTKGSRRIIRIFAPDEGAVYRDLARRVRKFESDEAPFVIATRNMAEHEAMLSRHVSRWASRGRYSPDELPLIALDAQRTVANFLASFYALLEQNKRLIIDQFGSPSSQVKMFTDECSNVYDASASYRAIYALRNFSQHYLVPLTEIRGSVGGKAPTELLVGYNRAEVLAKPFGWQQKDRDALQAFPPFTDITPLMREATEHLKYLHALSKSIRCRPYIEASRRLSPLLDELAAEDTTPHLVDVDDSGKLLEPHAEDWLSVRAITFLREQT